MHAPVEYAPCISLQNPRAAITDANGRVIAFAAALTKKEADENASYIVAALNHYLTTTPPRP